MRIICHGVDEFLRCLDHESSIFQSAIRVSVFRRPKNGTQKDATKFDVVFQASAVVHADQNSEFLLEVGHDCGKDFEDSQPSHEGTEEANALRKQVKAYAEGRGWIVLPGAVEI